MPKPEVGEIINFFDRTGGLEPPYQATVLAIFDSLDEDWGDYGHEAVAMSDFEALDAEEGQKAVWYAVVCNPDDPGETWAIASYEQDV